MTIATWLSYLVGQEQAILLVAASPWSLLIGGLFVISAGFARTYAQYDLRRKPRVLLLPLAASLATSAALFHLVYVQQSLAGLPRPTYLRAWLSFIGLFWMTAPLAWIYAIPYERFFGAAGVVKARLWSLGLVSLWRVMLTIRVLQIVVGYGVIRAAFVVLLFADVVAMLALHRMTPRDRSAVLPLLTGMGGITARRRADIRLLQATGTYVTGLGCITLPVWGLGALLAAAVSPRSAAWREIGAAAAAADTSLLLLAIGSVLAWLVVLPFTQRKQRLRSRIDALFRGGRVREALAEMSAHLPADFPANWEPPPAGRFGHDEGNTSLLGVCEAMAREQKTAPWLRKAYSAQLEEYLGDALWYWLDDDSLLRTAALLSQLAEGPHLARIAADAMDRLNEQVDGMHYSDDHKQVFLPTPSAERDEAVDCIRLLAAKRGHKR